MVRPKGNTRDIYKQPEAAHAVTWNHAASAFLALKVREGRKAIDTTRSLLKFFGRHLGKKLLSDITTAQIEDLVQDKLPNLANGTLNRYMAAASGVLTFAERRGWTARGLRFDWLPEPEGRIRYLTREEAARLIAAVTAPHLRAMVRFSLATGLRRANVTGLQWENVDMAARRAIIWGNQAKAGKKIGVPLSDDAMAVLRQQEGGHPVYVFSYRGNKIFHTNTKAWAAALMRAGIKDFRWHDLRHTWATWHIMAGTPLHVLQQLGGWGDLKMVLRYAHLAPEHLAEFTGNSRLATPSANPQPATVRQSEKLPGGVSWTQTPKGAGYGKYF